MTRVEKQQRKTTEKNKMPEPLATSAISVSYPQTGASTKSNEMGMRAMQERAYQKRGVDVLALKLKKPSIRVPALR